MQKPEEPRQAVRYRHLHKVTRLDDPRPAELPEPQTDSDAQQHHNQRCGNRGVLQRLPLAPHEQHHDRQEADRGRAGVDVPDRSGQFGERVLVVRLLEGQIPFRVGVVAEEVGDLFQNQDHPDGGQEALDDAGWEERSEEPGPGESQADLDQTRKHHRQEERRERPKYHDLGGDDRRQTGGRAAGAGVRPAQHPHEDATDDPGRYPREQLGTGRQRYPQAQGYGHEEHNQAGCEVARQGSR